MYSSAIRYVISFTVNVLSKLDITQNKHNTYSYAVPKFTITYFIKFNKRINKCMSSDKFLLATEVVNTEPCETKLFPLVQQVNCLIYTERLEFFIFFIIIELD